MEYLRSQVALEIPVDDDKDMPGKIDEFNLKLILMHELGILDQIQARIPDNTLPNLAKFITVLLSEDPSAWRGVMNKLKNLNLQNDNDLLNELNLNKAHEILSVFGIEREKE